MNSEKPISFEVTKDSLEKQRSVEGLQSDASSEQNEDGTEYRSSGVL